MQQRYKGVKYPIEFSPKGFLHSGDDISQIKSNILVILLTFPGERIFEPEFGTPLYKINFNQPEELVKNQARMMIAKAIKRWEKRIQVVDVRVDFKLNHMNQYDMRADIDFIDPINLQKIENMSLETTVGQYNYCR